MSNLVLKKSQNQMSEYLKRLERIKNLKMSHELYRLQCNRVKKQLLKLKEKDDDGKLIWKKNLRDDEDKYDVVLFHHPKYKRVVLTKDKLKSVEDRLKSDETFLKHLESKIKKNSY